MKTKTKKSKANKKSKFESFKLRLLSGILLVLGLVFVLYIGGDLLFCVCAVLSIIGLIELFQVFKLANSRLAYIAYLLTIFYYIMLIFYKSTGILLFLILLLLLLLIFYVFSYPKFNIKEVSMIFFGIIYVAVTFSFIYLIRTRNYGIYFVWLIFISSWGSDTCAYCTGMLFGKHKLSPILSPNKTIEGAVGGIIGASVLGAIYAYIIFNKFNNSISISYFRIIFSCALGTIISMLGDLTASAIKRDFNVKDYGNIIPGHGGILDRFDSVIFTAPAFFFMLSI